jgi:sigma-E factor negative regulatory protein RseB
LRRLVVLLVGAGLLLPSAPVLAGARTVDASTAREGDALAVLERAVQAGRTVGYRGTQRVASWRDTGTDAATVGVSHLPGHRSVLRVPDDTTVPAVATAALDARVVSLLAASYDLAVAGTGRCTGRSTTVVEARRDGGQLAGRFWVDEQTGLLLRREVYREDGRRLRSSAFVSLEVRAAADVPPAAVPDLPAAVDRLRARGWRVPDGLPGGFRLFEARLAAADRPRTGEPRHVLHLAYSDGLSTTSLFAQRGTLGSTPPSGFRRDDVGGRPVWVRSASPERAVWSGDGAVWTLVSDAPADVVRAAVAALPRDRPKADGVLVRLHRGLARLGAVLSPFH